MPHASTTSERLLQPDEALRLVVAGTVSTTGVEFFRALVKNLCRALDTAGAWITEIDPEHRRLRSLAFWVNGEYVEHYEYDIAGTPCQPVIEKQCLAHFPDKIIELFPADPDLPGLNAVSYMGVPLLEVDGTLLGHLAVLDTRPMPRQPQLLDIFELFAERAVVEYRRLRAAQRATAREEQLSLLLDSAMDAILVLDSDLAITRANPAAERVFGWSSDELSGRDMRTLLDADGARVLAAQTAKLSSGDDGDRTHWFAGDLEAVRGDGTSFPAEATLSCFTSGNRLFHTIILRNIDERRKSEAQIRLLSDEAEYLREVVRDATGEVDRMVGDSPAMRRLFDGMDRVAATDATVLVLGETGTGKELIARRIHQLGRRGDRPLVRVNCAAIPGALMESEFFGHERGAFTGATTRREGRFAMADGGSILLDEIGELPLDLQAKLLRVLQEGEFERVGSTTTRKVDVRVIAATNRDLERMAADGNFREDLFYRLNVFPLTVPPLRERSGDIALLAQVFADRFGRLMGRSVDPIAADDLRRLEAYPWPGNVRELQNVVERAIILSTGSKIEIARALPATASRVESAFTEQGSVSSPAILNRSEMLALERDNILRALDASNWKISGDDGAARLLDLPASTLSSRMKALEIVKPG